ncbi:MAG TPA: transglycosylase SLT domain-containing protein [Chloroflexota bacterium]|nr:transglycosylase SLT domain-containing protein [Chloroflexota bacterium]
MLVTFLNVPALLLASIFNVLGLLALLNGQPAAPQLEGTRLPVVEVVEPTATPFATPTPTTVIPTATATAVVNVVTPPAVVTPQPVAGQPSTASPVAPTPTTAPRIYPTNREVGILRPAWTPTPVPYTGQKLGPGVPGRIVRWEAEILTAAERYKLDPNLIAALMNTESTGDPEAVSGANAVGLLQVIDGPRDPQENVLVGTKMLADSLQLFDEDLELALAAYNAGFRTVLTHKGIPPFPETQAHIQRTLASYERFRRTP